MAALPYMQLYVADYLADTMHLNVDQHGAYLLLIMNYWQTGKPLPDNDQRLQCVCRTSAEHWQELRPALEEFFVIKDGYWYHNRLDKDLEKVRSKSESARKAAEKRHQSTDVKPTSCERNANAPSSDMQTASHTDTDTDTEEEHKETASASDDAQSEQPNPAPPKKKSPEIDYSSWPEMPDDQILKDWLKARAKARAVHSQTAINAIGKELQKAVAMGYTVNQCGEEAATRGWRGFKAEWMKNSVIPANRNGLVSMDNVTRFPGRPSVDDQNREVARRWAAASGGDCHDAE